jgi:pyruvate kinase
MALPTHKTRIVCTIGPVSESPEVLARMIEAGMNVARLNFSHSDFPHHEKVILNIRRAAEAAGKRVAILADLPGPKIRIGRLAKEPVELKPGDEFTLTTEEITGDKRRVSVSFSRLPQAVKTGDILFLDDGLIQLETLSVTEKDVICRVAVGGELRSRKGINLPGVDLGISAFTEQDRVCLEFAAKHGVDAVSQSFVETAADITTVRETAWGVGYNPFIIAKIERVGALVHMESILDAADGIMIARGDLGVEIPIEQIALVQKRLIGKAHLLGKPVITATQMLESMTGYRRPTRAEATDVANAILDGTDCVMLSAESAIGKYPVEAVAMLARIAATTEPYRSLYSTGDAEKTPDKTGDTVLTELIARSVKETLAQITPAAIFVPTRSGATARRISRFRLPVWVVAVSSQEATCQQLQFSYGVYPVCDPEHPDDWKVYTRQWLDSHGVEGHLVVVTEGPSSKHPDASNRMEIFDLKR